MQRVSKCKNKRCGTCNIIIEGIAYIVENTKTFITNRNFSCNSKYTVYIIKCTNCMKIYIGRTQILNKRVFLHKSNIKLPRNRKLYVPKHIHEFSKGVFKLIQIYLTDDNSLLRIKEKTS